MVAITAYEKEIIHKKYPKIHIARTMKNDSKRHHYYMEEVRHAMRLLRSIRSSSNKNKE